MLKGEPVDEILLGRDAYVVDADGQRTAEIVFNGVPVRHAGDRLVLFLNPAEPPSVDLLRGFPTRAPVMLDGIAFRDGDAVSITDGSSPPVGATLDEIVAAR